MAMPTKHKIKHIARPGDKIGVKKKKKEQVKKKLEVKKVFKKKSAE